MTVDHRKFIRHPADIPIEFSSADGLPMSEYGQAHDVSFGGLAFVAEHCPPPGSVIDLTIPTVSPPFQTRGVVVWCRCLAERYEIGVRFLASSDAFKARMVEQVCHIEQYKRDVLVREGRKLTPAAAAREWISKYAERFPGADAA
ncbi:MAG: PilZ domain-containing protein [Gemmatimonadetes bacterium]|nr:PilZ domain-containing protein [Gemmatimonadota bacterium]